MRNTKNNYENLGVTEILNVKVPKELKSLQKFIYNETKHLLLNIIQTFQLEKKFERISIDKIKKRYLFSWFFFCNFK